MPTQNTAIQAIRRLLALSLISLGLSTGQSLAATGSNPQHSQPMGAFLGAKQTQYPDWFKESFLEFADDVAEAADDGKRIILLFTQDGCPYCNALVEENLSQKAIEDTMRKHFETVAINLWGDRQITSVQGRPYTEKAFSAALKVQFTPTLIFLNEQGKSILRLNGYLPPERFQAALDYVSQKQETQQSFRDYYAQHGPQDKQAPDGLIQEPYLLSAPQDLSGPHRRPYTLFFEQQRCPACQQLHQGPLSDPDTRAILAQMDNYQLDIWSERPITGPDGQATTPKALAQRYQIQYAPTLIVFNAEGKEIIRSEASFKSFHTQSILDYVLSGAYKTQASFQRYITDRSHALREQGIDVDIWK